jgi:beta-galactosidase GanA
MKPIWPKLAEANLNTVLAVVSWDLIEPQEGKFDFSLVDDLIKDARHYNLRLVLLWFGSWKNGVSTYVPVWVKTDCTRFPRARNADGNALEILSTFSDASRDADAKAFAALMRHIKEVDGQQHTVIMMQVENESGVLGDSRDRSKPANEAYSKPVPKELMDYLQKHKDTLLPEIHNAWETGGFKTSGTWEEVFGANKPHEKDWRNRSSFTDEIFMAWQYAKYIEKVAEAGKAEYPIPMYVNAWLDQEGCPQPGEFPSGGPLSEVMDIWKAAAPHIDMLCPDLYVPDFKERCEKFSRLGNPLFIPETRGDKDGVINIFYALGQHNLLGFSPFGIERIAEPNSELAKCYSVLSKLAPFILQGQSKGTITGVAIDDTNYVEKVQLGGYALELRILRRWGSGPTEGPVAAGIVISTGPNEFLAVGKGLMVTFSTITPGPDIVGLATVEEGTFVDGKWIPGRRLNGDEIISGRGWRFPPGGYSIQKVKVYRYH